MIGSIATIFILIRIIWIPKSGPERRRGIGIWIALVAGIGVIAAGVLRANEEL